MLKTDSWSKALKYIPNGCQTLSKRPETYVNGVYPKMLFRGTGCEVYDEEDKSYIDYISALGAILMGYGDWRIDDAVCRTIQSGQLLLSLPHPKETDLAEKLCNITPNLDMVKFFKTGSEATSAAVRIARAYTKRRVILKCGYNGWHDWAMVHSTRNAGIPSSVGSDVGTFTYNDLDSLRDAFKVFRSLNNPVAAVIMEPVVYDEPRDNFLAEVKKMAHKEGSLLIFDEIVTGMRFGLGGASKLFDIVPDLSCFGKALGNGFPIAGVLGRSHYMQVFNRSEFIASGTFSGDLIGISAALAVIDNFEQNTLWANGLALKLGFNGICKDLSLEDVKCVGYAPRTKFEFPTIEHRAVFWQECVKRGILFGYTNFPTMSHGPRIIESTLNVCRDALLILKKHWSNPEKILEGDLPKVVL